MKVKAFIILSAVLALLVSPAFAATATLEVSSSRVNPGDVVTITGKISGADNLTNETAFDYRGACVAPARVVLYDTGRVQTNADGTFSFSCIIPGLDNLTASGVPAVQTRSVIPVVVGVAFNDSGVVKKVHDVVFVVNAAKLNEKLSRIESHVQKVLSRLDALASRVDSLVKKANETGRAQAMENLGRMKSHVAELKDASGRLLAKLQEARQSGDIKAMQALLKEFEGGIKNVEKYSRFARDELAKPGSRK